MKEVFECQSPGEEEKKVGGGMHGEWGVRGRGSMRELSLENYGILL